MIKKPLRVLFEAMYRGKYQFEDFLHIELNGAFARFEAKGRSICNPNEKLKAYHSFLNLFLFEYLPIQEDVVFSYRKGFSSFDAVARHATSRHFYQTDICDFFSSLDRDIVRAAIESGRDTAPVSDLDDYLPRILDLVLVENVLPMGFSTSPVISNACLRAFDVALSAHCAAHGLIYTRYADDIIVSGKDRLDGLDGVVKDLLRELFGEKLAINSEKSKFTSIGRKIKLLGMVVLPNGKVTIDMKRKQEIETLLHFYMSDQDRFLQISQNNLRRGESRLAGLIAYANTIDRDYLDKLRKKFGATIVDAFLHRPSK